MLNFNSNIVSGNETAANVAEAFGNAVKIDVSEEGNQGDERSGGNTECQVFYYFRQSEYTGLPVK